MRASYFVTFVAQCVYMCMNVCASIYVHKGVSYVCHLSRNVYICAYMRVHVYMYTTVYVGMCRCVGVCVCACVRARV